MVVDLILGLTDRLGFDSEFSYTFYIYLLALADCFLIYAGGKEKSTRPILQ